MDAPEKVMFKGALYVLAKDEEKKPKGKKAKDPDVFANVRLRGDGISFYINVLFRAKDEAAVNSMLKAKEGDSLPFVRKARSVPESADLTADQLEEALAAKKAGELWHIYAENVGWYWRGDGKDIEKVSDVQRVLDMLGKYSDRARNPIIYAVVSNKIVGKW
jgi:hypothetical protein